MKYQFIWILLSLIIEIEHSCPTYIVLCFHNDLSHILYIFLLIFNKIKLLYMTVYVTILKNKL